MKYLYVKYENYIDFVNIFKTNRLAKNLKIMTNTKGELIKEIFRSPIKTQYNIENISKNLKISFFSNKNFKYRLDIFRIIEENKSKNYINHLAFSDYENDIYDDEKYEELVGRNEMIEVLDRIHFILKDLVSKKIINNHFCIGGTKLDEKNRIYKYMLKVIVGENGFTKQKTEIYKTKFGLYFKI